tara:strand:- start:4475 stop:4963 length:489 start_codon:yes stop_codon:yes gene_type:complete
MTYNKNPKIITYKISLLNSQKNSKKKCQFRTTFEICKAASETTLKEMFSKQDDEKHFWNDTNQHLVCRSFLNFFIATKKHASDQWTETWHVKNEDKKTKRYMLYDCSESHLECLYNVYKNGIPKLITIEERKEAFDKWIKEHQESFVKKKNNTNDKENITII